jgi:hypothetical protein
MEESEINFCVVWGLNLSLGLAAYALRLNHKLAHCFGQGSTDTTLFLSGKKTNCVGSDGQPVRLISGGGERKNRFRCQSKNQWSQRRPQSYTYHTHHSVHQKKQVDRSLHNLISNQNRKSFSTKRKMNFGENLLQKLRNNLFEIVAELREQFPGASDQQMGRCATEAVDGAMLILGAAGSWSSTHATPCGWPPLAARQQVSSALKAAQLPLLFKGENFCLGKAKFLEQFSRFYF